ncbi:MAG: aldo/keto reductase [Sandaracinaceae bacterium]
MRALGRTGAEVWPVALGGEGILRTHGRDEAAVAMIVAALDAGIRYCETAPAYDESERYYGEALRARPGARDAIFLASKTHDRTRDGSLRLLEASLERLGTDHLDLWQLHDLRTAAQLEETFGEGGAMEAVARARSEGMVRHVGLTGHFDPAVLVEAMRRYEFDTVLCPINPVDLVRVRFTSTVIAEARRRGMGVLGMKVTAHGRILEDEAATLEELVRYAATFVDTCLMSCHVPEDVERALAIGRDVTPMPTEARRELEERLAPNADRYMYFAH